MNDKNDIESFENRCKVLEKCVPESRYREQLSLLHAEMLSALNVRDMQIAELNDIICELANNMFDA